MDRRQGAEHWSWKRRGWMAGLAAVGFVDAAYLTVAHRGTAGSVFAPCGETSGCGAVLGSEFATIGGVPLAVMGMVFYGLVALFAVRARSKREVVVLGSLTVGGAAVSAGLVALQALAIGAFCPFCLLSAAVAHAMAIVAIPAIAAQWPNRVGAVVWVSALALVVLTATPHEKAGTSWPERIATLGDVGAHRMGSATAPVQVSIFSDFRCTTCKTVSDWIEAERREDPSGIAVVYRPWPLDDESLAAAVAAEAAGAQGVFWNYSRQLYENPAPFDPIWFARRARMAGADVEQFLAEQDEAYARVETAVQAAHRIGIDPGRAPSVFINGRPLERFSVATLSRAIDDARRRATQSPTRWTASRR